MKREGAILFGGWLALSALLFGVGWQNLAAPGLFYDEAIFGGLARDFLTGRPGGGHLPGVSTVEILGGPFPVFVQPYLGALKCWLLIPVFKLLGATLAVLRGSNLLFSAAALLVFMGWTWRLLGLAAALLAGLLLALDPAFFFLGVLDWGSLLPSLLCRFGGFYLVLLAWRRRQARWALAAGVVLGLGFFNKIDFGVIIAGTALAAACIYATPLLALARSRPKILLSAILGFLLGAGPVLSIFRVILRTVFSHDAPHPPGEFAEKLHTLRAMYDGSYFYRLMEAGGLFDKMYDAPSPVWTPFGLVVLLAAALLSAHALLSAQEHPARRIKLFLVLSAGWVTLGALILPGAVRIHHTTMVYPFPHLLIAAAAVTGWEYPWRSILWRRFTRSLLALVLLVLALGEFHVIVRTERLIRETGGRGWWSRALVDFSAELKPRPGLTVASLDWGFNEQLEFLTSGVRLEEPFWQAAFGRQPILPRDANHVYLAHPPELSLSPLGGQFMASVARENTNAVVRPWRDGQGRVVFYTIAFPAP